MNLTTTQLNILRTFVNPTYVGQAARHSRHSQQTFKTHIPTLLKHRLLKKIGIHPASNNRKTTYYVATAKARELLYVTKCPECHTNIPIARHCLNCGAPLETSK